MNVRAVVLVFRFCASFLAMHFLEERAFVRAPLSGAQARYVTGGAHSVTQSTKVAGDI